MAGISSSSGGAAKSHKNMARVMAQILSEDMEEMRVAGHGHTLSLGGGVASETIT